MNHEEIIDVMDRYIKITSAKVNANTKQLQKINAQRIVELAEKSGMEQWEVRAWIERETGLDV